MNELFRFIVNKKVSNQLCVAVKDAIHCSGPSLHDKFKKLELDIENILCYFKYNYLEAIPGQSHFAILGKTTKLWLE